MRRLLTFFILVSLLVVPAFAQTVTYTCPADMALYTLTMYGNSPTYTTFELYRQDGTTTSGSWSYQPYTVLGFPVATQVELSMDGETDDEVFVTPGQIRVSMYPSRNLTELAETRWIMGAGQGAFNNANVEKYGVTSPIIGFMFAADSEVTYKYTEDKRDTVAGNLGGQNVGQIMDIIYSTLAAAITFLIDLGYWLKFFFVDNLTMILALFLAVPMAFAAKNSRGNPEKFLRQYFKTLRGFFEFIFQVWRLLLESIGTVRGWFRI